MKIKLIFGFIIIVSFGAFWFVKYSTFLKVDKCLDSGGSWNYETKECEKDNWENEIDTSAIDFILNSKTIENQKIQLQVSAFKEKILLTKNSEKSIKYGLENTHTTTEKELNLLFQKGILKIEK